MANFNIDYLVVAGGASGANQHGGGGGAGGLRTSYGSTSGGGASAEPTLSLTTGIAYPLTVGDGGAGVTWINANLAGNNGVDSQFNLITSIGGGGGSSYATQTVPGSGGSGGGGGNQSSGAQTGASGEPGQGYAGGLGLIGSANNTYPSGGGGGAGGLGGNATYGVGGNGGDGLQNDITVTTTGTGPYYAGGGGSATYTSGSGTPGTGGSGIGGAGKAGNSSGNPGNPQTGSGGGGTNGQFPSGSGGSGVIILRYPTADIASYTATGLTPTETTDGTDTILSFTTVGTGSITFTGTITKITNPELFNLGASASATQLPVMTNTERIAMTSLSVGEMIFNSTTDKVEYWDGTKWYGITYYENPCLVTDPDTSLVLYLDAANVNSFDPATDPNTWYGLGSATSNNASNVQLAPFNATTANYLANFGIIRGSNPSAASDFGQVPHNSNLNWATNKSLSVWVKCNTATVGVEAIASKWWGSQAYGWVLNRTSANILNFQIYTSNTTTYATVSWDMTSKLNQWMQVTVTQDANYLKIYVDGGNAKDTTAAISPGVNTRDLYIGRYYSNTGPWNYGLTGYVNEIKMWSKTLSPTEVTAEFDRKKACFGL